MRLKEQACGAGLRNNAGRKKAQVVLFDRKLLKAAKAHGTLNGAYREY